MTKVAIAKSFQLLSYLKGIFLIICEDVVLWLGIPEIFDFLVLLNIDTFISAVTYLETALREATTVHFRNLQNSLSTVSS
jgi:hypothetical protein